MYTFEATLERIGINPFVFVPDSVLTSLFRDAGRTKGPIPVYGSVNGKAYTQTLIRYQGCWRFYINTVMLPNSPKRIGETVELTIAFDPRDRSLHPDPDFMEALVQVPEAHAVFQSLSPSLRNEIIRYIASLKTSASRTKNIQRAIGFLLGNNRFIGRDKPGR
ncbi:YdeI/OmpD-associated family protein [Sphingobacterium suaedae]|uniref:YdeI/OmpD-associated family protein n=1 Tax=Sphingobacterium suaedae TaxID=1686402 RepID=A0ABW5KCR5_9SPHI